MIRRRTKIIATIGPACSHPDVLRALLQAGTDVLRINFSHAHTSIEKTLDTARELAKKLQRPLAIMADLQGPKIRIGRFVNGHVNLEVGQSFQLRCEEKTTLGNQEGVDVTYPTLCYELQEGDHLLLDDGLIELKVKTISPPSIDCQVIEGGLLGDNKGLNRKGGGLAAGALTEKDKRDMATAVAASVDYLCLSFIKKADDIRHARVLLQQLGAEKLPIIAKIERTEALTSLTDIIFAADGVMVARGDLGVEVGAAEVPPIQKRIISKAKQLNKIVITATQMMESMITHPKPTRAEVSDVANAILDGTDAVLLSAETARGNYPVKVIEMVDKVCLSTEKHGRFLYQQDEDHCHFRQVDQAIAMGTMYIANHFPIKAIIALTESGATALWMSRQYSMVPIFAISDNEKTVRRLSLVSNVFPLFFDYCKNKKPNQAVINYLKKARILHPSGSGYVLLTRGQMIGKEGGTNSMEIIPI